ncbi:MAG: ribonuclease D [Candidatus Paracaedimonas acanthamoebae]|uniref:Ribonuclease D n=1 Tax=Candidatus Paracaedimonas acanthamoebae TaxID=244581 RepID=A0A8J7PZA9_9PROT|nr:ribonuclease D [Candidatus Paracaedimonas acanthamoebae]
MRVNGGLIVTAQQSLNVQHHFGDLPSSVKFEGSVAIDTEAMGLNPHRDRLCAVQLSQGDGICHVVQFSHEKNYHAPNLVQLLLNPSILKIFHFARFDVALLSHTFKIEINPVYCTKIASKIARTFTDRHGLRDLCRELLNVDISKEAQTSDWGAPTFTAEQLRYAATDVLYLHKLKDILEAMLIREEKEKLAQTCFNFIPTCSQLDLLGYQNLNVFDH